ncbi:hypothetical protein Clacol_001521 [Clathrus columnatus]|uniref:HTH Mu-type domain-containing protein n=1 Tax=Clathrus columnatus TaxID=1419009 RepID=A0AAV4ZZG3_9AGAM|nr:hypothetical protein Clacol_001521 [Clathrus columnatus]
MEEAQTIVTEYIQSLDNLPAEVQHYLAEIRDKENKISDIQLRLQARMSSYLRHASRPGVVLSPKDAVIPEQISLEHAKLMALAEEKVRCAEKVVKLVSRSLGRLDVDLARALDRNSDGIASGAVGNATTNSTPAGPGGVSNVMGWMSESITLGSTGGMGFGLGLGRAGAVTDALRSAIADGSSTTGTSSTSGAVTPVPKRRRMNSTAPSGSPAPGEINTSGSAASRSRLSQSHSRATPPAARSRRATSEMKDAEMDMDEGDDPSGDPEDKTLYCTCRSLSYGKMVGCDNDSCPYQWVVCSLTKVVSGI